MNLSIILLSGGKGKRIGGDTPKQYLPLCGKPIAHYSFTTLIDANVADEIIVVCDPSYQSLFPGATFAQPGKERQDSVYNGLQKVSSNSDLVLIHDIARPILREEELHAVIKQAKIHGAATLAMPLKFTIKEADEDQMVVKTLDRSKLYEIQTPQVLKKDLLIEGFKKAHEENALVTDDVSLAELISHPVKLVMGSYDNIKITTPEDLTFAENILCERSLACKL